MNHFFAIKLPAEAQQEVAAAAQDWGPLLSEGQATKWYVPDDYHITLKFLGSLSEAALPELIATASPIAQAAMPFEMTLTGAGAFPSLQQPSVLWIGVRPTQPLTELAARIGAAAAPLGYPPERRPYQPHVTVARCRRSKQAEAWAMPGERTFSFWLPARFVLMQTLPPESRANGTKARYNTVHTFPFGGAHLSAGT